MITPTPGGAQGAQPAFYTYQAPGAAATAGKKVIALTFDDGPGPYTPQVLAILERSHVPATFFEIGDQIAEYPQYTRMVAAAGDPVEDHTWTHADLATLPADQFAYQIDQTQGEISSLTGRTPLCVRPPYDAWDSTALDEMALRGLTTMSYSVDPRDWSMPGVPAIVAGVVDAAFPGAVVDLHDGGGDRSETVEALPQIIGDLEARGFGFVSICGDEAQASAVYPFGAAPQSAAGIVSDAHLVGAAIATPDGGGYWLVGADGGVFSFGDAAFHGSMGGHHLDAPVVGMAGTPVGGGYWLVGADGGVFSFQAPFYGSRSAERGSDSFFAMCATGDGTGYLLMAEPASTTPS